MDNIKLFKFCQSNGEIFLDRSYMFVEKDQNLNSYIKRVKEVKELLIAIKRIRKKKSARMTLEELFKDLQIAIKKYANYSEFGAFINACDSGIKEPAQDLELLKKVTNLYLDKRQVTDIVPGEWIQAMIDKGSSRKKGQAGENKLIALLVKGRFTLVNTHTDFKKEKKAVAKFSSRGDFSNSGIARLLGVSIGRHTQGKKLDLIVKLKENIYFLEAKHLNTGGGGQNKQVLELIEVISQRPPRRNYHFVAFLDGLHSNNLLNGGKKVLDVKEKSKIRKQYVDLTQALRIYKENYWINTSGFNKLFGLR